MRSLSETRDRVAGKQAEQASLEAQQAGGQKVVAWEDKWALLEVQQVE